LRDFLYRHARRKRRPDPSRTSRRWLALESELREHEGVGLSFEHATRAARTGRIALAVDTSGSIDESLLRRFAVEVASVLEKAEPLLRSIVCDADVHQVHDFSGRDCAKLLRRFKFRGGGGTDFRPAIAEAAMWKPDLLDYLTDLQGDAGTEPVFSGFMGRARRQDGSAMGQDRRIGLMRPIIPTTIAALIPPVARPLGLPSSLAAPVGNKLPKPPAPVSTRL